MISNLSVEERQKLADLYSKLSDVKKSQLELNELTEPLNKELEDLEKKELDYDVEYKNLFESQKLEDIKRLSEITTEMVSISNRKNEIKEKLDGYEPDFEKYNSMVEEYNSEIDLITNVGVFGNGVVQLDKSGNVIKEENELKVEIQEFKTPAIMPIVNTTKSQIIETKKNVSEFIREKFENVKTELISLGDNVTKVKDFIESKKELYKEIYDKQYLEEEKKVNQIIEDYKNKKEENARTEKEAENLEFYTESQDNIADKMYIEQDNNKENIKSEDVEVKTSIEPMVLDSDANSKLFANIDKNDIELQNIERGKNNSNEFDVVIPENKATISNENTILYGAYDENNKLFTNMDKNDEELEKMQKQSEVGKYDNITQVVSGSKNRVATAKSSKIPSMVEVFNTIKDKVNNSIDSAVENAAKFKSKESANVVLNGIKKEELEAAKEKLKEGQRKLQEDYSNSLDAINNMGMAM